MQSRSMEHSRSLAISFCSILMIYYLLAKVQTIIVFRFPPAFNGWIIMRLVPRRLVRSHEYMTLDNNQLFEEAKDD